MKQRNTRKKKYNNKTKNLISILLIILIIMLLLVYSLSKIMHDKLKKINTVEINEEQIDIDEVAEKKLDKYRNIALFGVDSRKNNLEEGNRSDCIIIASINDENKEVKLVSIYRDTYVYIDGHGLDKINHAYSYGSAQLAINTLNQNLDLNIKEFVTVNFDLLAEIVNELGGITIEIDQEELTYINKTIESTEKLLKMKSNKLNLAGINNLDGVQAVVYSRMRASIGGDYKRTERMRNVLESIITKAKTKSITELNTLADKIFPEIYTNINISEILKIFPNILKYKITESIGWPYTTEGINLDKWYSVPVTLENNVSKLYQQLFQEMNYMPSQTVKEISNQIIEKTGYNK